jgi:hypothetical protein
MKPVLYSFFLLLILSSCRKEILIDIPGHESRLVVNCFFSPEEPFEVKVSASSSLYDSENKDQDSALVLLFADGVLADTLVYTEDGIYIATDNIASTGIIYSLWVECVGFMAVSASNSAPLPIPILNSSLNRNGGVSEEGYPYARAVFSFQDPPEEENYYELLFRDLDAPSDYGFPRSNDTVISREGDYDFYPETLLFTDMGIDGLLYTLEVFFNNNSDSDYAQYILELRAISPEFYAYKKRLLRHVENQYSNIWDGIGNPLPMYSNIESGYGIFAGYSSSFDTLR